MLYGSVPDPFPLLKKGKGQLRKTRQQTHLWLHALQELPHKVVVTLEVLSPWLSLVPIHHVATYSNYHMAYQYNFYPFQFKSSVHGECSVDLLNYTVTLESMYLIQRMFKFRNCSGGVCFTSFSISNATESYDVATNDEAVLNRVTHVNICK